MSTKRKADPADVLVNKLNVGLAKHKRLLASWSGLKPEEASAGSQVDTNDDDDFKDEALGYEQLGIGGRIPKDIQDGSFTRRTLTSNDKLLQQLMGKKAAKAHVAARQKPQEAGKPKKLFEPAPKKEESEDEEEGRAATFKSKRRKITKSPKVEDKEPLSEQTPGAEIPLRPAGTDDTEATTTAKAAPKDSDAEEAPAKSKPKGGSYLDELLAERSKKKKNKKKKQEASA